MFFKKINKKFLSSLLICVMLISIISFMPYQTITKAAESTRQMEYLTRGLVAIKVSNGVFLSWRLLGTEETATQFNIYRNNEKITPSPIDLTNYTDTAGFPWDTYQVSAVKNGVEADKCEETQVLANNYLNLNLNKPANSVVDKTGEAYTYSAGDCSTGDVDGDGQYEIFLKWDPSNSKDNGQWGYTGNVILDCYKLDGTQLWRMNLGKNIRGGAHYTQFMVYDLDGDGKAEIACKTADGTIDGGGTVIGDATKDWRNSGGFIIDGPEYLTVFSGLTGKALTTVDYDPPRGPASKFQEVWGDTYGNRMDRFLACIAYLDGVTPSLVMCRGYYTRANLVAYKFSNNTLTKQWRFDSLDAGNESYAGQGNHNLAVGDVDGDSFDEIVYGSSTIDHDGKGLYTTGHGHGDAMHLGDFIPERSGLEVFQIHESVGNYGTELRDAKTGETLWAVPNTGDVGRGVCGDVDPTNPGTEYWSTLADVYDQKGNALYPRSSLSLSATIWWDGDLSRESIDKNYINKFNPTTKSADRLISFSGAKSINGTKGTPCLQADLFGDWREEVILPNSNDTALRIYTTDITSDYKFTTLMHDKIYRLGVAWQNVAYNQSPDLSYFLGTNMQTPSPQPIYYASTPAPTTPPTPTTTKEPIIPLENYTDAIVVSGFNSSDGVAESIVEANAPYNNIAQFDFSNGGQTVEKTFTPITSTNGKATFSFDWNNGVPTADGSDIKFLDSNKNVIFGIKQKSNQPLGYYVGNEPLVGIDGFYRNPSVWYHIIATFDLVSKTIDFSILDCTTSGAQSKVFNNISFNNVATNGDLSKMSLCLNGTAATTWTTNLDNLYAYQTKSITEQSTEYKLGFKLNANNTPVANALIKINSKAFYTDSNGDAAIMLKNGSYSYSIVKEGYDQLNGTVVINNESNSLALDLSTGADKNVIISYIDADNNKIADDTIVYPVTQNSIYRIGDTNKQDVVNNGITYEFDADNTPITEFRVDGNTPITLTYKNKQIPVPNKDTPLYKATFGENGTTNWSCDNLLVQQNGYDAITSYTSFNSMTDEKITLNNVGTLPENFVIEYDVMYTGIGTASIFGLIPISQNTYGSCIGVRLNSKKTWDSIVNSSKVTLLSGSVNSSKNRWLHYIVIANGSNGYTIKIIDKITGSVVSSGTAPIKNDVGSANNPVTGFVFAKASGSGLTDVSLANFKVYSQNAPFVLTNTDTDKTSLYIPLLGTTSVDYGVKSVEHISDVNNVTYTVATPSFCIYSLQDLSGNDVRNRGISVSDSGVITVTPDATKGIYKLLIMVDDLYTTEKTIYVNTLAPTYSQTFDKSNDFSAGSGRDVQDAGCTINYGDGYKNELKLSTSNASGSRSAYKIFSTPIVNNVIKFDFDWMVANNNGYCDVALQDSNGAVVLGVRLPSLVSDRSKLDEMQYYIGTGTATATNTGSGIATLTNVGTGLNALNAWYNVSMLIDFNVGTAQLSVLKSGSTTPIVVKDIALATTAKNIKYVSARGFRVSNNLWYSQYLDNVNIYADKIAPIPADTNLMITDTNNQALTTLTPSQTINISYNYINSTDIDKAPNIIVAIFNSDDTLYSTKVIKCAAVIPSSFDTATYQYVLPNNITGKYMKIIFWNGLYDMIPILKSIVVK